MKRHDRKTIALLFTTLEAGGVKLPESFQSDTGWNLALELWSGVLGDVSPDDLVHAVSAYLRLPHSPRFPTPFPSPGQVLQLLPGRKTFDDADATWGEVWSLAGRRGRANPPVPATQLREQLREETSTRTSWSFDPEDVERDEAIRIGVQAVGGWRSLCLLDESSVVAARASFRGAYRSELERRRFKASSSTSKALLESGAVLALSDRRRK
jgi:hypothetical protein